MSSNLQYRRLEAGEIIREGDEVDNCANPWHDDPKWVPTTCVGQTAPDPQYPAHRQYRRLVTPFDKPLEQNGWKETEAGWVKSGAFMKPVCRETADKLQAMIENWDGAETSLSETKEPKK